MLQNPVPINTSNTSKEISKSSQNELKIESEAKYNTLSHDVPMLLNGDDSFDKAEADLLNDEKKRKDNIERNKEDDIPLIPVNDEVEIKPLTDISVTLENIKPGILLNKLELVIRN